MPLLNQADNVYLNSLQADAVYAGSVEIWRAPAPEAIASLTVQAGFQLGNIALDVQTANDPHLADIILYVSPKDVPLDKVNHAKQIYPVARNYTGVLNYGDPTIVNVLANPDFGVAVPPPTLGRSWGQATGQLSHDLTTAGVQISTDGVNWSLPVTPNDPTIELKWYGGCWVGAPYNVFVMVSYDGQLDRQIMTSPDGVNWTSRAVPEDSGLVRVAYSPSLNKIIAVGQSGTNRALVSTDGGVTWTAIVNATINALALRDICWSPELSMFVIAASTSTSTGLVTSPDGVTWTRRGAGVTANWCAVIWAGPPMSKFVAMSSHATNKIAVSSNGTTWTLVTPTFNATLTARAVAYSPTLNLLVGLGSASTSRVITSPDGTNWTDITATVPRGANVAWTDIVWGGGLFVAVPGNAGATSIVGGALTSPDGVNWTMQPKAVVQTWQGICYSPTLSMFVMCSRLEGTHADYALWPSLPDPPPAVGEAWRGYLDVATFTKYAGFDVSIRLTSANSFPQQAYPSEDVVVAAAAVGVKVGRRVLTGAIVPNNTPALGAQPSIQATVNSGGLFKETLTCAAQGEWDLHAFPRNKFGVEGPETIIPAVLVV